MVWVTQDHGRSGLGEAVRQGSAGIPGTRLSCLLMINPRAPSPSHQLTHFANSAGLLERPHPLT